MRIVNAPALLRQIFEDEPGLPSNVECVELVGREHADVYRVTAGGQDFIAHLSTAGTDYLQRLRTNLGRVAALNDERLPRVAAWCHSDSAKAWAVLVCNQLPGEELNRTNSNPAVLDSLAELLLRLHTADAPIERRDAIMFSPDDVAGFSAFGETLLARLADLPISPDRVRRHLDRLASYLHDNAEAFVVTSRLMHGDLHRSNVVVDGSRVGLLDWGDLRGGDYAYDLACLKFMLDSLIPRSSTRFIRECARVYRDRFNDMTLELRLRYFMSLAGLVRAINCADDTAAFGLGRSWRVRACYLHSERQWAQPLKLDGPEVAARPPRTEEWALDIGQPLRGLFYLVAPRRVS
jgi:aminoglycoside phosphotransferase (APT) family kinase protein